MKKRSQLRKAQLFLRDTIMRCIDDGPGGLPGALFAFDMGSGKTAATLTGIVDLMAGAHIKRTLVVAPLEVARVTWPDEIEEWEHTKHLDYTVLRVEDYEPNSVRRLNAYHLEFLHRGFDSREARGHAAHHYTDWKHRRLLQLMGDGKPLHIINREGLPELWKYLRNGKDWDYDLLVIDEASMLKRAQMRVTRGKAKPEEKPKGRKQPRPLSQFGVIAKAAPLCKTVVELSGTPNPNGLINLWGLIFPIDLGQRLGRNITAFRDRWFSYNEYKRKYQPHSYSEKEIHALISDITFSLSPEDYPDTPGAQVIPLFVDLHPEALRRYRDFSETMYSEEYDIESVSGGVHFGKKLQFANGSMYREDRSAVWIHDEKLNALKELYERLDGEPLLVAYSFQFDLDRIRKTFKDCVVWGDDDPREIKKRWNNGEIKMLVAHAASIGHGQNLQYGGHYLVWYGLNPDLEYWLQFNKRLDRPGQEKVVYIYTILARGTDDEGFFEKILLPKWEQMKRTTKATEVDRKHTRE